MYARSGMAGVLTDTCYYSCAVASPNSLPMCAQGCCQTYPDSSDSLCAVNPATGAVFNLPESPAETSQGVLSDIADTLTGSYPGGSNAAAAALCANNPTFACWLQQNASLILIGGGIFLALMALNVVKR